MLDEININSKHRFEIFVLTAYTNLMRTNIDGGKYIAATASPETKPHTQSDSPKLL